MWFEVDYVQHTKIMIEAENMEDAEDQAATMDWEDIAESDSHDYAIFGIRRVGMVEKKEWKLKE